ncbi:MAG: nucleotidyl transferase AbiEii/AbiGii toxin family protein [Candidatus Falkowbacteria bacterium]
MLNKEKHQLIMGRIMKDIYSEVSLAPLLGFKGGTCAYFLYGLPRFSVDLDFDLLAVDGENQKMIFEKIVLMLEKYGQIKDSRVKRFTIFALLSYGDVDHNIKVEINVRQLIADIRRQYEVKEYLGMTLLAAKKDYLFAGKLAALTSRTQTAMRDIYDIHYFAKNNWEINAEAILAMTGKNVKEYLADCIALIEKTKGNQILSGLGELLSEKEKDWTKSSLKAETVFLLKNYGAALK